MSVGAVSTLSTNSAYAGIPGAASLGLATPAAPSTSPATPSTAPASKTTNDYADIPGYDALGLTGTPLTAPNTTTAAGNSSVAGFDALGIKGNGQAIAPAAGTTGSVTAATGATGENVYQTAYDGIVAASNQYLQNTLINGNPSTQPVYAAGSSAAQFALLQNTLSAISTGLQNGQFQGTGFNQLA